jgi:hypothetical protein
VTVGAGAAVIDSKVGAGVAGGADASAVAEGLTEAAGASTFVLTPSVIVTSIRSKTLLAKRRKILMVATDV